MSQQIWSSINPDTTSGTMLAALLTDFKDAYMSGFAGTSRPTQLQAGGMWIDTTQQGSPTYYWIYKLWTGTVDIEVFRININSGYGGALTANAIFEVQQISADTQGAIQELVKNRFDTNGQVLNGDTIAEIRMVGRTITSTDPVVGYIKFVATDDETATAFGGTFSFYSTPDATSAITEHLKFISGFVEIPVPLLINALQPVSQNVGTAATIVQLSADFNAVEFTGATATDVQGIKSDDDSKEVILHNRSSANVTLKHLNGSAASADQIELPNDQDYTIEPDATITLIYVTATTKWKLKDTVRIGVSKTSETITGLWSKYTTPAGVTELTLTTHKIRPRKFGYNGAIMAYDTLYMMGDNQYGELGVGNVTNRSSPVSVAGPAINWWKLSERNIKGNASSQTSTFALDVSGNAYGWGRNFRGNLGVGNVTDRSSPVAVLGGFKFNRLYISGHSSIGMTADGTLLAWGGNSSGQLGLGDVTPRSSPVAVLGGFKFSKVVICQNNSELDNNGSVYAIRKDTGTLYSWGYNGVGQLGHNDFTPRSSPVAVAAITAKIKKLDCAMRDDSSDPTVYALTEDGDLYAWGRNSEGTVGNGNRTDQKSPVLISPGGIKFKDYWVIGDRSIVALTTTGTYYGWGLNSSGQCGVGDTTARSSPVVAVSLNNDSIEDYSSITTSALAIMWQLNTGTWRGLGYGEQLGDNSQANRTSAVQAFQGKKIYWVDGTTGIDGNNMMAIGEGEVYSWGNNFTGCIGNGTNGNAFSSPVLVLGPAGINPTRETNVIRIPVTASTQYNVKLGEDGCSFGSYSLGNDIEKLVIEYTERGNA